MNRYLAMSLLMIAPLYGLSKATEELVKSMVPHGEITSKLGADYSVKTQSGSKIQVEFDLQGKLDEASGISLGKGDLFEPGNGLYTLQSVAHSLIEKGHKLSGDWKLQKDSKLGWIYELYNINEEEQISYVIDAKTSEMIKKERSF